MNPLTPIRSLANRSIRSVIDHGNRLSRTTTAQWQKCLARPVCTVAISMRPVSGPWQPVEKLVVLIFMQNYAAAKTGRKTF